MQKKEKYSDTLPKKYLATGVVLFNEAGELMILQPTYKENWEIPGGIVEANESPRAACKREIKEEIGLNISIEKMLCVDYSINFEGVDNLHFVFDGGVLTQAQMDSIQLQPDEIKSFKFISIKTEEDRKNIFSRERLGPRLIKALAAREARAAIYLEKGV